MPDDTHHGGNGYDGEQLGNFLTAIDKQQDELDTLKSEYMTACKGPRNRIKDVVKSVRESGIDVPAFRELMAKRLEDRKRQRRLDDMEDDQRSAFEQMLDALGEFGDTPLGAAALKRAQERDQTLTSLNPSS